MRRKGRAEWKHIDILIINANKKAIVIENKINPAGDRPKQLWRYYNTLERTGITAKHTPAILDA